MAGAILSMICEKSICPMRRNLFIMIMNQMICTDMGMRMIVEFYSTLSILPIYPLQVIG